MDFITAAAAMTSAAAERTTDDERTVERPTKRIRLDDSNLLSSRCSDVTICNPESYVD